MSRERDEGETTFRVPPTSPRCAVPLCNGAALADRRLDLDLLGDTPFASYCPCHLGREVIPLPNGRIAVQWELGDTILSRA